MGIGGEAAVRLSIRWITQRFMEGTCLLMCLFVLLGFWVSFVVQTQTHTHVHSRSNSKSHTNTKCSCINTDACGRTLTVGLQTHTHCKQAHTWTQKHTLNTRRDTWLIHVSMAHGRGSTPLDERAHKHTHTHAHTHTHTNTHSLTHTCTHLHTKDRHTGFLCS